MFLTAAAAPDLSARQRPLLNKAYYILMTLRGGSTSLTRRIARRDRLSRPDEYVNTDVFADTLKHNPPREVIDLIAREKQHA